ncbi:VHS domain-containing protein [Entamoeba marina]
MKVRTSKRRITWDTAAQLVEYATSAELRIVDDETNRRICNLIKINKTKSKDLLNVLRKRMLHKENNVVMLSLKLMVQTLRECPEIIDHYATDKWQDCFIGLVLRKNLDVENKVYLLSIVRAMAETYPAMLLFQDTYEQMLQHGINFPEPINLKKEEKASVQVGRQQLLNECLQLQQYCDILSESFEYLTLVELGNLKTDEFTFTLVGKLQNALPTINSILTRKNLDEEVLNAVTTTHSQIVEVLARYKELTEKVSIFIHNSEQLVENTQFMYESKKFR